MKKITLIILFIVITFFLFEVYGSGEEKNMIGGFSKIQYKGRGKKKEWVDLFSEKMSELYKNFWEDVTNGMPPNDKLKEKIIDTFNAGINHELGKLKNCMGGYYSDKIKFKERNGKINLKFDSDKRDGYHEKSEFGSSEKITLRGRHLEEIISDIASSIKNKKEWSPDNIYTSEKYPSF